MHTGKLPAKVMLSDDALETWQEQNLEEAKAAILLEMQRRQQREALRASRQRQLRAAAAASAGDGVRP